jgi:hypothetical protein
MENFFEKFKVKTFNDLVFKTHPNGMGGVQATMKFPNGHSISVVGGSMGLYGDGVKTFEIWTSDNDDVVGWLTPDEVTQHMLITQSIGRDQDKIGFDM